MNKQQLKPMVKFEDNLQYKNTTYTAETMYSKIAQIYTNERLLESGYPENELMLNHRRMCLEQTFRNRVQFLLMQVIESFNNKVYEVNSLLEKTKSGFTIYRSHTGTLNGYIESKFDYIYDVYSYMHILNNPITISDISLTLSTLMYNAINISVQIPEDMRDIYYNEMYEVKFDKYMHNVDPNILLSFEQYRTNLSKYFTMLIMKMFEQLCGEVKTIYLDAGYPRYAEPCKFCSEEEPSRAIQLHQPVKTIEATEGKKRRYRKLDIPLFEELEK